MKPYTYLIKHKPTGLAYYGVRYKNVREKTPINEDLWTRYFTSSAIVKELIEEYGKESFEFEIRRTFETSDEATFWETKVLRRCKVVNRQDVWLNRHAGRHVVSTPESRKKISEYHKGKPKSEEHKKALSKSQKGIAKKTDIYQSGEYRDNMSKIMSGEGNAMYGKTHNDETRKKIGQAVKDAYAKRDPNDHHMKHKIFTDEERAAISKRNKGRKRPQSAIDASAAALRGRTREKKHCPHCDKMVSLGWYNRHGDNCKKLKSIDI